ncbi:hypothetical protein SteCoe_884 [Stentor coeruleus]|uniref:Uncharacterized protein n=1 Tax=Stentor coeruleus TaxID=5963 RepID=A0A1R2D2Z3_9CILI|nr:hypothetical protein SteCoe_884 [Stentor coeruleus]
MKSAEWYKAREARKKKWVARLNYLSDRVQAVLWVLGAIFVIYYSNFFHVMWESEKINSLFFGISLVTFGIFTSMTIYASFALPNFEDIEVVAPRLIPVASMFGFICFMSSLIAFWPVWGWYTPLMLITMLMGYLMAGSFLPKSTFGSVLFLVMFIGSALSSRYIPHEGLLH